jgi:hypothetical protein
MSGVFLRILPSIQMPITEVLELIDTLALWAEQVEPDEARLQAGAGTRCEQSCCGGPT